MVVAGRRALAAAGRAPSRRDSSHQEVRHHRVTPGLGTNPVAAPTRDEDLPIDLVADRVVPAVADRRSAGVAVAVGPSGAFKSVRCSTRPSTPLESRGSVGSGVVTELYQR